MSQTLTLSVVYVAIATAIHSGIVALAGSLQSTIVHRQSPHRAAPARAGAGRIAIWFALTTGRS